MVMEDFIVKKHDSIDDRWYMYIGFHDKRIKRNPGVSCYGSAVIHEDDGEDYCFSYSFDHSSDWNVVSGMKLTPLATYNMSMTQVQKIASSIFYNIKEFISKMN